MHKITCRNKRDKLKEASFKEAYGFSPEIYVTNCNDENWDWVTAQLDFNYKGRTARLIEYFKEGEDNSTAYVELFHGEDIDVFHRWIDAELMLVDLLKD